MFHKLVKYHTFDDAVSLIAGIFFAKMNISSAFRLLYACPEDFCLLGNKHSGLYYNEKFSMGCSLSCSLFEKSSTFLHWKLSRSSKMQSINQYIFR